MTMTHIQKTKSRTWKATIYVGKDPATGKYQRKSRTFDSKKEAEYWAAKSEVDKQDGVNLNPEQYTVAEYLRQWLSDYAEINLSPTTYDDYRTTVTGHIIPELGQIKLSELKPTHIQHYQSEKLKNGRKRGEGGLSNTTVQKHHRILSKALKQAVMLQLIKSNPCTAVPAPTRNNPEIETLNINEIRKMLEMIKDKNEWLYSFVATIAHTGLRRGEAMGLKWKDVDFDNHKLKIRRAAATKKGSGTIIKQMPKNHHSRRNIEIGETVIFALKKIKNKQKEIKMYLQDKYMDQDLVFCKENGEMYSIDTPARRLKRALSDTDIDCNLHKLRHSHATILVENGIDISVVQHRLGHSTSTTTRDIYVETTDNMQKEAVNVFEQSV